MLFTMSIFNTLTMHFYECFEGKKTYHPDF